MPRRKAPTPDPLAGLKVEVYVTRGEVSLKAEATLDAAARVAVALNDAIAAAVTARPRMLPSADHVPATALDVIDEDALGYRRRPGFRA